MVIMTDKQFKKIEKQLDEIKEIKDLVREVFFQVNSFYITYNCDQVRVLNKDIKCQCEVINELVEKSNKKGEVE